MGRDLSTNSNKKPKFVIPSGELGFVAKQKQHRINDFGAGL